MILSKPQLHQPLGENSKSDCASEKSFSQKFFVPSPHRSAWIKYYGQSSNFSTSPQAEMLLFEEWGFGEKEGIICY